MKRKIVRLLDNCKSRMNYKNARSPRILYFASTLLFATMSTVQLQAQPYSFRHIMDIDTLEFPGIQTTALQKLGQEQDVDVTNGTVTFMRARFENYGISKCVYVQDYRDAKLHSVEIKTKGESGYEELLQLFDKITMQTSQVENRSTCIERSLIYSGVPLTVSFITDKRHRRNSLIVEMSEN